MDNEKELAERMREFMKVFGANIDPYALKKRIARLEGRADDASRLEYPDTSGGQNPHLSY